MHLVSDAWVSMNSPFTSVIASRAAFDVGQRSDDGVVSGLNLTDIAGQPPLSQRIEGVAFKIKAPPLTPATLDLGGNTYAANSEVNNAGVLRSAAVGARATQSIDSTVGTPVALKATETVALKADRNLPTIESITFAPSESATLKTPSFKAVEADAQVADNTAAKRTAPALLLPNFSAVYDATGGKYADASYNLSMQPDGGIKHQYTAADFSTCTLTSKDGSAIATVTDPYARPTIQESISTDGSSTVTRYAYKDEGNRKSMFASSKEVTEADGTVKTFNYDKFGKVLQA